MRKESSKMSFNEMMDEIKGLNKKECYDEACFLFLQALDYDADEAWSRLQEAPTGFYMALLPLQLDRFNTLHIQSKLESIRTLLQIGEYQRILDLMPKVEQLLPGSILPMMLYAEAHYGLGHYNAALQYIERIESCCLDSGQEEPVRETLKLQALYELNDPRFETCAERILSFCLDPDLLILKSFYLRNNNRYEEALAAAEEAIGLEWSSTALFQCGWCRRAMKEKEAYQDFHEYISTPYRDDNYDYYLPFVWVYLGEEEKAAKTAKEYFAKHGDSHEGYFLCAEIYSLIKETAIAYDCLEQAMQHGLTCRTAGLKCDPALATLRHTLEGTMLIEGYLYNREKEDGLATEASTPHLVDTAVCIPAETGDDGIKISLEMYDRTFSFTLSTAEPRSIVRFDPFPDRAKDDIRRVIYRMEYGSQQPERFKYNRYWSGQGRNITFDELRHERSTLLTEVTVMVMDGKGFYHNLLGQDILSRFSSVAFSFAEGSMVEFAVTPGSGSFTALPFKWADGRIAVQCGFTYEDDSEEEYTILDTGNERSLIPTRIVQRYEKGAIRYVDPTPNTVGYGILPKIKLGEMTFNDIEFHTSNSDSYPYIGRNVLRHFSKIHIDYANLRVLLFDPLKQ